MWYAAISILASLISPEEIETTPQSMLWLLPITIAVAIVYKAMKLPKIKAGVFLKEVALLFGSLIIFMAISASVLYVLAWLIIT